MNSLEPITPKLTPSEALLETILRSCDADKYLDNFRNSDIDTNILRNLIDEDLQVIGIKDVNSRKNILEHFKNLQIPTERRINLSIDNNYILHVINQTSVQLNKHYANMAYILSYTNKKDLDLCYIKLAKAGQILKQCVDSLDKEVQVFKKEVLRPPSRKKSKKGILLITTISLFGLVVFTYVKIIKTS